VLHIEAIHDADVQLLRELLAQRERALLGGRLREAATPRGRRPRPRGPARGRRRSRRCRSSRPCGGTLTPLVDKSEDAEEITVVERRFVLVRHR